MKISLKPNPQLRTVAKPRRLHVRPGGSVRASVKPGCCGRGLGGGKKLVPKK